MSNPTLSIRLLAKQDRRPRQHHPRPTSLHQPNAPRFLCCFTVTSVRAWTCGIHSSSLISSNLGQLSSLIRVTADAPSPTATLGPTRALSINGQNMPSLSLTRSACLNYDILGFAMGGAAALLAALYPTPSTTRVRKVVAAATTGPAIPARLYEECSRSSMSIAWPRDDWNLMNASRLSLNDGTKPEEVKQALKHTFFTESASGQQALEEHWDRVNRFAEYRSKLPSEAPSIGLLEDRRELGPLRCQRLAWRSWETLPQQRGGTYIDPMAKINVPVLVMNGINNSLIPASRSWELMCRLPKPSLNLYEDSGAASSRNIPNVWPKISTTSSTMTTPTCSHRSCPLLPFLRLHPRFPLRHRTHPLRSDRYRLLPWHNMPNRHHRVAFPACLISRTLTLQPTPRGTSRHISLTCTSLPTFTHKRRSACRGCPSSDHVHTLIRTYTYEQVPLAFVRFSFHHLRVFIVMQCFNIAEREKGANFESRLPCRYRYTRVAD